MWTELPSVFEGVDRSQSRRSRAVGVTEMLRALTLLLLLPYCAWTFDCARRLGRSEYHLHPDLESELSRR